MASPRAIRVSGLAALATALLMVPAGVAQADGGLRADQSRYQFVCDGSARHMGNLSGSVPGELITFSSPEVDDLLSGHADGVGDLSLSWQCGDEDVGTVWHVAATGQSGGSSASFEVEGVSSPATQVSATVEKSSGDVDFPMIPSDAEAPRPPIAPQTTTPPSSYELYTFLITACGTSQQKNCYEVGKRYLSASGEDLWIDVGDLIWSERPLWALYEYWLRDNVEKALQEAQDQPGDASVLVPFSTNWQGYNATGNTNDWHNALGHFSVQLAGDVWVGPVQSDGERPVRVRYRTFLFDIYNFDGQGDLGQFRELATEGWAAEFRIYGAGSTITIDATTATLSAKSLGLQW